MKRLLIAAPQQHGYNNNYRYYAQYLANQFEVEVLCIDNKFEKVFDNKVTVRYVEPIKLKFLPKSLSTLKYTLKLAREVRNNRYDIIIVKSYHFLVFFIGLLSRAKLRIIDIQSGRLFENKALRTFNNTFLKLSTLSFDKYFILTKNLSDYLRLNFKKGVIIPLGANNYCPSAKKYDQMYLLYVGTFKKRRIEETIEGLATFYNNYKGKIDIRYDIVGFGSKPDIKKIHDSINANQLDGIVTFHGRKSQEELKQFFEISNIGITYVPITEYYDYQPSTKLIEYALAGLVSIATNTKENRAMITEKNGVICDDNSVSFSKSLEQVYSSLSCYREDKIRESLKEYEWSYIMENNLLPFFQSEDDS